MRKCQLTYMARCIHIHIYHIHEQHILWIIFVFQIFFYWSYELEVTHWKNWAISILLLSQRQNCFTIWIKLSALTHQSKLFRANKSSGVHFCINKSFKRIMRQFTKSPLQRNVINAWTAQNLPSLCASPRLHSWEV